MEKFLGKRVLETLIIGLISHRLPRVLYFFCSGVLQVVYIYIYIYINIHIYIYINTHKWATGGDWWL